MICEPSASIIVIIHTRKVVVYQRVRVYHFNGAGKRGSCPFITAEKTAKFINKKGTYPLSSAKKTVFFGVI